MNEEREIIDGVFLPNLEVKSKCTENPLCFHFRFSTGWAIFTACESTCTFGIQSDWGDYSHRWPRAGMPEGTTFLDWLAVTCKGSADYVAGKMAYESPQLKDQHDEEGTLEAILREILKSRRERDLTKSEAAERWEDLKVGHWNLGSPDLMFETCPDWAWEMFDGEPPMISKIPGARVILIKSLIPFFGKFLSEHLASGKALAQAFFGGDDQPIREGNTHE